jgi:hypothetical protein
VYGDGRGYGARFLIAGDERGRPGRSPMRALLDFTLSRRTVMLETVAGGVGTDAREKGRISSLPPCWMVLRNPDPPF